MSGGGQGKPADGEDGDSGKGEKDALHGENPQYGKGSRTSITGKHIHNSRKARGIAYGKSLRIGARSILPGAKFRLGEDGWMEGFAECFGGLTDPRSGNATRHDLLEILMIALCTFLCGGESCVDMADLAAEKEPFLREFLVLKHGLPSHDTFSRLFRLLDPDAFRACFQTFVARLADACEGVIAIDGKSMRRSFDKVSGKSPLHMVSA
jgi:hypothetical protein